MFTSQKITIQKTSRLLAILNNQIDGYLKSIEKKWFREDGKKRAEKYKIVLADLVNKDLSDEDLLVKVRNDIKADYGVGLLDTSSELREFLTIGLLKYLGVSEREMKTKVSQAYNSYVSVVSYGTSTSLLDHARQGVYLELIESNLQNRRMIELK